ncbi:MAG: spinster family MFS transporter [Pseudomonadales bacterium]
MSTAPASATGASTAPATHTGTSYGSSGYRNYVLISLTVLYTLNFVDRVLVQILAQPIIEEFKLQDWQFGLLSGFGFAFMYTLLGIPIARLSERANRVRIIAAGVILWSVMTALCGLAGSFIALLLFRVGVGVGEAALTPPANSLIADYFIPKSRARAMGTYAMGVTLGGVFAAAFGGPLAEMFSWRTAFIALGVPGIVIGLIFLFTVKEPPRGYSDPPGTEVPDKTGLADTLRELFPKPSFWLNMAAAATVAFVGYGYTSFQAAYFQRAFGMPLTDIALMILVPVGLVAAAGAFASGVCTEKLSARFPNAVAWLPGWGLIICVPFYWIAFTSSSIPIAIATLMIGAFVHYGYLGSQYTIAQGVATARSRATAVALFLFVVNMIGYGLGPLFVGFTSDYFMSQTLLASSFASELSTAACKGSATELIATLGPDQAAVCAEASASGLRQAILVTVTIFAVAGVIYLITCRKLQQDLVAKMS